MLGRFRKMEAIKGSPDLNSLFNFLELFHYGFKTGQSGNRTLLVIVELNTGAAVILDTFLYKRTYDLSDEQFFLAFRRIPLSFG